MGEQFVERTKRDSTEFMFESLMFQQAITTPADFIGASPTVAAAE